MHTDLVFPMVQSKQSFEIPLILEEPYDLAETAALHYGPDSESGLLAGADHSTAFLSMSGYGKSHTDDADGTFCYLPNTLAGRLRRQTQPYQP
jgi:hypothetical protein